MNAIGKEKKPNAVVMSNGLRNFTSSAMPLSNVMALKRLSRWREESGHDTTSNDHARRRPPHHCRAWIPRGPHHARCSGDLPPPSPPAEKATARQDETARGASAIQRL